MIRLIIAASACIGLIALFTLIVTRLIRSRQRGMSVRMQVFLALAGIIGAFALGLGILVLDRIEARAERLAIAAAGDEALAIAAILKNEIERNHLSFAELGRQLSEEAPGSLGPLRARTSTGDMATLGVELLSPSGQLLFPQIAESRASEPGAVFVDKAIKLQNTTVGIVRVVKPTIVVEAMLADFAPTVLVLSLVLGAAAAGAAAFIGRTIAAPIESLSEYTQRVSIGERPRLPSQVTGREVNRLVASIDTMRERLEGRPFVETFAADLSHELKNPVAAIRASAEVLADGALNEPENARRFVARIHEATIRIERLLAELLSLAEVETRGPEHLAQVALGPLILLAIESAGPQASRISARIDSGAPIRGDRHWLQRAVSNLIANALTHSAPGSPVEVKLSCVGSELTLTIENEGTLDEHVRKSLFRRFVTTRREQGGTGLGLSIVRAVAEAHGGHAEFVETRPFHVGFRMRFPLSGGRPGSAEPQTPHKLHSPAGTAPQDSGTMPLS